MGTPAVEAYELILRKLAIRDDAYIEFLQSSEEGSLTESTLEVKARSLVRIAALAAIDATTPSYLEAVESAREGGASDDEIVGVLIAVIPAVGVPRVVSAAPKLALALVTTSARRSSASTAEDAPCCTTGHEAGDLEETWVPSAIEKAG